MLWFLGCETPVHFSKRYWRGKTTETNLLLAGTKTSHSSDCRLVCYRYCRYQISVLCLDFCALVIIKNWRLPYTEWNLWNCLFQLVQTEDPSLTASACNVELREVKGQRWVESRGGVVLLEAEPYKEWGGASRKRSVHLRPPGPGFCVLVQKKRNHFSDFWTRFCLVWFFQWHWRFFHLAVISSLLW